MKHLLFILLFAPFFAITSCNNNSSNSNPANYEENKMSLEDQEKSNPLNFLTTDGTYRGTLLGGKMNINGTITNSATLATFKDITLQVHFYSQTKTEIGNANYVIYEFFSPQQTKDFSMKIEVPDGTSTLGWDIVSAVVK